MLDKEQIRLLAEAERLMDEGKIPWVWANSPYGEVERLAVNPQIMEEFGLVQGQSVNSIIVNAISIRSLEMITEKIEQATQKLHDSFLDEDFDFREMMGEKNEDNP